MSEGSKALDSQKRPWAYAGPGILEWVFGGLCTAMIADTISNFALMDQPQTAEYYYGRLTGVIPVQWGGIAINALVLFSIIGWIISQKNESPLSSVIMGCAGLGSGVIWGELIIARNSQPNSVFMLTQLPVHPIGSWGIIGAQVYLSYLLFKLPDGRLPKWGAYLLKAGFAACVWMVQANIWEVLWRKAGR